MWQKLIQSEQMCVVIFHGIALASREKKTHLNLNPAWYVDSNEF